MTVHPCPYPKCKGPDGQPNITGEGICQYCRTRVERDLQAAPAVYTRMHLTLSPGENGETEPVSGTPSPPAPLDLAKIDAGRALMRTLVAWHTAVARADALMFMPTASREGWRVDYACKILLPRVDRACAVAPDLAVQLARDVHYTKRLLGELNPPYRLVAPCPECDLRALVRYDGTDVVRCRACGAQWAYELYRHLARVLVAENADT